MTKLNQLIAVEKGVKAKAERDTTACYHVLQKETPLVGISRTYQPTDDEGETFPPESTLVQVKVEDEMKAANASLAKLFDVTLEKDATNCVAKADVKIGDEVILADVPLTYLLFLEKQLIGLHTQIVKLPTLDPAFNWTLDSTSGVYRTDPVRTVKTKKIPKNWVKAEATDKHPAQVEIFHEDVKVGEWTTVKFSGAITADRKQELLDRVGALGQAVKFAREEANMTTVVDTPSAGKAVLDYVFA